MIGNDDDGRTQRCTWQAALHVAPQYRGRGVALMLAQTRQQRTSNMNIEAMKLGTEIPDLNARFGAVVHERRTPKVCVKQLPSSPE